MDGILSHNYEIKREYAILSNYEIQVKILTKGWNSDKVIFTILKSENNDTLSHKNEIKPT